MRVEVELSIASERVKEWCRRTRRRIIESLGGKCVCCNYHKLDEALETHHLDGNKEFSISDARRDIRSWARIVVELRKCVLVCIRCHLEVHRGVRVVPRNCQRFIEAFVQYRPKALEDECPVCHKLKIMKLKTCSRACAATLSRKADWSGLKRMLKTMTVTQIADKLGVSYTAVKKQMKKPG